MLGRQQVHLILEIHITIAPRHMQYTGFLSLRVCSVIGATGISRRLLSFVLLLLVSSLNIPMVTAVHHGCLCSSDSIIITTTHPKVFQKMGLRCCSHSSEAPGHLVSSRRCLLSSASGASGLHTSSQDPLTCVRLSSQGARHRSQPEALPKQL